MNEEIKNILNNIDFNNNKLIKINNNLYLTNNQIDILKRYKIDYETSNSLRDLMIKIENIRKKNENAVYQWETLNEFHLTQKIANRFNYNETAAHANDKLVVTKHFVSNEI